MKTFKEGTLSILVGQGIGDSVWSLTKVKSIAKSYGCDKINVAVNTSQRDLQKTDVQMRSINYLKKFNFINEVRAIPFDILKIPNFTDDCYNYVDDFTKIPDEGIDMTLIPNHFLERGGRLEDWLPEYEIDWNIMDHFIFTHGELKLVEEFKKINGDYAVFYLGPESGNTHAGHNRNLSWTPMQWIQLGKYIESLGIKIVVTGAPYDRSFWEKYVKSNVATSTWIDKIGAYDISQTFAFLREAKCCVSYQSGIGITAQYLGIPTVIWWRAKGDSINPYQHISFEESMASSYVSPEFLSSGKFMPCIYGRESVSDICTKILGWIK